LSVTTIVVVDDASDMRLLVRALLRTMGDAISVVGEASDGDEGLEVVRRERPAILITDLVMPGLNGVELTRQVRQELPRTKIIQISSHTDDAYRLMASDSGADIFVNKSVISDALVAAVRNLISRIDDEACRHSPGPVEEGGYGG
jgi:DNA-binding NarL/FixJ family response regulator